MTIRVVNFGAKVVAAISIINLVEDARWIRLQENLATWLEAYSRLVSYLFAFLTGWVSVSGFVIDPLEQHLIVIFTLVTAAMVRGVVAVPRNSVLRKMTPEEQAEAKAPKQGLVQDIILPMFAILLYVMIYTVLYGTFSPVWATILSAVAAGAFIERHVYIGNSALSRARRLRAIGQELAVVFTLALMLIFVNYMALQLT